MGNGRNPFKHGSWRTGLDILISLIVLFVLGIIYLTYELKIFEGEYSRSYHARNPLRFVVVDLNKSKSYPENFVSMLPMRIDSKGKIPSIFTELFGNKSLIIARKLLTDSLKNKEYGFKIKAEIKRRLNLLEPTRLIYVRCRVCRHFFKSPKEEAYKQKICPKCIKRFQRK